MAKNKVKTTEENTIPEGTFRYLKTKNPDWHYPAIISGYYNGIDFDDLAGDLL